MVPRGEEPESITLSWSLEHEILSFVQQHVYVEPLNAAIVQARWVRSAKEADEIEPLASQETRDVRMSIASNVTLLQSNAQSAEG